MTNEASMTTTRGNGGASAIMREDGFGGREIATVVETQAAAMAAQARAQTEARYKMALLRPRDYDDFRAELLKACDRPPFAALAEYEIPRAGKSIFGVTIRFVEEALRCFKNVLCESTVISDDETKRQIRVTVTDLESNITYPADVVVTKTIERRDPGKKPEDVLGSRHNSEGVMIYILKTSDDELLQKQNALVSKTLRTLALRVLPSEVVDEARKRAAATFHKGEAAKSPDQQRNEIADSFASLNVLPSQLKEYLGCPLEQATPAQIATLRKVFAGIRSGDTTMAQVLADKAKADAPATPAGAAARVTSAAKAAKGEAPKADAPPPAKPPVAETIPAPPEEPKAPPAESAKLSDAGPPAAASSAPKPAQPAKREPRPRTTPEQDRAASDLAERTLTDLILGAKEPKEIATLDDSPLMAKLTPGAKGRVRVLLKERRDAFPAEADRPPTDEEIAAMGGGDDEDEIAGDDGRQPGEEG